MAGVFLTTPTRVTPPAGFTPWTFNEHTWTGWDGASFDLATGRSGVLLMAGARGLGIPPITRYTSSSASVHGSRWRGMNVQEREAFWPLKVYLNAGSQAWIEHDRAFWHSLHPEHVGTWTVTQPNGDSRSLQLRLVDDGQFAPDTAPELIGWARYGVTMVAEDPFWKGAPIDRTWGNVATVNYFGGPTGGGFGPPYYITEGSSASAAVIQNPGDVDAWPVWTLAAPFTSAAVGVGTKLVNVPFAMASGSLSIDSDPTVQTAVDHLGNDRTADLGTVDWASIPPSELAVLNVSIVGTGRVTGRVVPRYLRAT
jgi:hypothetical protein